MATSQSFLKEPLRRVDCCIVFYKLYIFFGLGSGATLTEYTVHTPVKECMHKYVYCGMIR